MNEPDSTVRLQTLMAQTPDTFCLVHGASEGQTPLNAFDNALLEAGVGDTNLMRMSSILPPGVSQAECSALDLPAGGFIPLAYAHVQSSKPGEVIASAVAVGIPEDDSLPGVIMEYGDCSRLVQVESRARQMIQNAFENRHRALGKIRSVGVEHRVKDCAASFAGVVLWYK